MCSYRSGTVDQADPLACIPPLPENSVPPPPPEARHAVLRALQAVESELCEPLQVVDLARAAGYSLFHFSRLFNGIVHHSPFDYLMRRRLTEAARKLQTSQARILDIAIRYRFSSQESFSRAFKRMFGRTPGESRDHTFNARCGLDPVDEELLQFIHSGRLSIQPCSLPSLHLVGLMIHVQPADEDLKMHWQNLEKIAADRPGTASPYCRCTCTFSTLSCSRQDEYRMVSYAFPAAAPVPAMLVEKHLPAGNWVLARFPDSPDALPLARRYLHQTWFPGRGFQLMRPVELTLHANLPTGKPASEVSLLIPASAPQASGSGSALEVQS